MAEETPTPEMPKRPITAKTVVGVLSPGNRAWDKRIRNGTIITAIVTPLLWMVDATLKDYREQNAATQAALRASLVQLPAAVKESVTGLKDDIGPLLMDMASLKASNTEMMGWVRGRLKCPACVCPSCPEGKVIRFVPEKAGK